jgi:hypothetical protein
MISEVIADLAHSVRDQGACRIRIVSLPGFAQVRGLAACFGMVVRGGVEPPTFRFSGGRSYQLSYLTLAM